MSSFFLLLFSGYYTFKKVVLKINLCIVIICVNSIIKYARYECKYKNNHSLLIFEEHQILPIWRAPNLANLKSTQFANLKSTQSCPNTSFSKRLFFGAFHIIRPISRLGSSVEERVTRSRAAAARGKMFWSSRFKCWRDGGSCVALSTLWWRRGNKARALLCSAVCTTLYRPPFRSHFCFIIVCCASLLNLMCSWVTAFYINCYWPKVVPFKCLVTFSVSSKETEFFLLLLLLPTIFSLP